MEERLESASASPKFAMLLIGMSSITVWFSRWSDYGVIAYSVARGAQEFANRMAFDSGNRRHLLRAGTGGEHPACRR